MVHERPPQPVIEDDYIVASRPSLRLFAYCGPEPADLVRATEIVELLRGPLRETITVCSGTHLKPKARRHVIRDRDWDALGNGHVFAIYTTRGVAQALPKRLLSESQIDDFRRCLAGIPDRRHMRG